MLAGKIDSEVKEAPLISIITVVYNGYPAVEATLLSVLSLNYPAIEYILIDGCSNDGTVEIIKKYKDRIASWVSEPDQGIYHAMNKGIERATGEWINFMNCGDRFATFDVLEIFKDEQINADIVYGEAMIEYPTFETRYERFPLKNMWKRMPFCHQACFVRTSIMKVYKFDLHYALSADFDFMYRAYTNGKDFLFINKVICRFDFTTGASRNYGLLSTKERRDSVLKHEFSLLKWLYYFVLIAYVRLSGSVKRMVGEKLTAWVTRLLRT